MKWSVGNKVMAKWPGSTLYYHAVIKSINDEETVVIFEEGTEMDVSTKDIKFESAFIPKRRSKSPSRSRRRSKSRSRSPGRSPGRKTAVTPNSGKSPRRPRSSSRGKKMKNSNNIDVTEEKKKVLIMSSGDVSEADSSASSPRVTKPKVGLEAKPIMNNEQMMTRQRKKESPLSSEIQNANNSLVDLKHPEQKEFGGTVGTFFTYFSASAFTLILLLISTEADWSVAKFKLSMIPRDWKAYFNPSVFACYLSFLLFHAVIYLLPLGHNMKGSVLAGGKRLEYKISAKYALLTCMLVYALLFYYKIRISFIHDFIFQLAASATIMTLSINLICYLVSFTLPKSEINPAADTGSHIYDSFMGRILNPRIGNSFDLKMYLYRPAMLGWILLIFVEVERVYHSSEKLPLQFIFLAASQLVYVFMELFYDEEQCPFMFDIKNEGLGFVQLIGELVYVPFFYSIPVRYAVSNHSHLTTLHLFAALALFALGMYLISASGSLKAAFKKDPYHHSLSSYESLPASRTDGERLLVSGLWGKLRHPNYLGEILIGVSWALACGLNHVIVWVYPLYLIGLLVHRSMRVEVHSARKHGLTWERYCERVQCRIFPGVF